jgi:hypothetical protein
MHHSRLLRPAGLALMAAVSLPAQTVDSILLSKTEYYLQNSSATLTIPGSYDTTNPFGSAGFNVTVSGSGLSAPTVTLATGSTYATANPSVHNGGVLVLNTDGSWGYGAPSGFGVAAPTALQNGSVNVNTYFANSLYTVSVPGQASVGLTLAPFSGQTYPAVATMSFSQGTWSGGKLLFDPTQALSITTSAYAAYFTGGIGGSMNLSLDAGTGFAGYDEQHFSRLAPAGSQTDESLSNANNFITHTFAANTFTAGNDYTAEADFARIISQDLNIAGSFSVSYYDRTTAFTISAIPEPSAYAGLTGLGALGLAAWRRRRASA